jgi:outer membrane protein OmpA-like peptidoglycan-associated protein
VLSPHKEGLIMKILSYALIVTMLIGMVGCASMSNKEKGAVIGAGSGAAVGGAIGSQTGNTLLGAIIGAAVGGAAGAYIVNYMDDQAEEIERDLEGATVERVGEGIKITFDSGILFDTDSAAVQSAGRENLINLAKVLQKYEDTDILIEGHTDATGSEEHNLSLSDNRANSVATILEGADVQPTRFTIMGYGEVQPIGDNETADGRQVNRRVDIAIMANDKLKDAAEKKSEG